MTALVVVDVQNDFVDGTLAIRECPAREEGADVVPVINHMIDTCSFDVVVYSLDWHPQNHISFVDNVAKRKLHHSTKVRGTACKQRWVSGQSHFVQPIEKATRKLLSRSVSTGIRPSDSVPFQCPPRFHQSCFFERNVEEINAAGRAT